MAGKKGGQHGVADLSQVLETAHAKYGTGSLMYFDDDTVGPVESISTGSLGLDLALGVGGLPRGRITEIFGPEGTGKTTVALQVIAQAQKNDGAVAFIDAEHALDPSLAVGVGVNLGSLLISQPNSGEEGLEITDMLARSGKLDVIAVDSVAALVPQAEIDGEMGDQHVGLQARLMSQAMRKLNGGLGKRTVVIFINQLRHKIGVSFGNPETTPGGLALKYYSSVRLDVRRIEALKNDAHVIGNRVRVRVVKNKVAPPFRQAEADLIFGRGISKEGELLDLGVENGIIKKSGAFYAHGDQTLGQGRENARASLEKDPERAQLIEKAIHAAYAAG